MCRCVAGYGNTTLPTRVVRHITGKPRHGRPRTASVGRTPAGVEPEGPDGLGVKRPLDAVAQDEKPEPIVSRNIGFTKRKPIETGDNDSGEGDCHDDQFRGLGPPGVLTHPQRRRSDVQ